uniref:YqaJ domain-containing protein n=1 Tax=Glossina pallidipes TaxID=7398 RepID=A0A1A9ZGT8_GLOPL
MIIMHVDVEPGFRKADINSIPQLRSDTIFGFIAKVAKSKNSSANTAGQTPDTDLRVDYVQIRRVAEITEVRALVFPAAAAITANPEESHVRVSIKIDIKKDEIIETSCEQCQNKESCAHLLAFIFWLHRKSTDSETPALYDFWGHETESLADESRMEFVRIRDLFACDELRMEGDLEATAVTEMDGAAFLEAVLDEMEGLGLRDSILYSHSRPVLDEFEPLFIHHTLLDACNNGVKDTNTFVMHMEDQAKQGLFDRLAEVSKTSYKTPLWLEVQYMRLRCSLIHRIASRCSKEKDSLEDEQIVEALFCKGRDYNCEEKQQLKQHKRFILKQTEKLENKTYHECGLLLNESYPYICAAPDGITDDHIVEIKAPRTDQEFEKYLEGRETIAPKYMAQIQIQMYMANVTKALYCVLSPTFDTNGALHYVWVQADMEFVASLLGAAEDFWKEVAFPRLAKIYLANV